MVKSYNYMRLEVFGCDGGKHQKIFAQLQCMHELLIDGCKALKEIITIILMNLS